MIAEVEFDVAASLQLLLAYGRYERKYEQKNAGRSSLQPTARDEYTYESGEHTAALGSEMELGGKELALQLQAAIDFEYGNHFSFESPEKEIFDVGNWIGVMKKLMPLHWDSTSSAVPKSAGFRSLVHRAESKDVMRFFDVIMLIRQRNNKLLHGLALLPALAAEAGGQAVDANFLDSKMRLTASITSMSEWFAKEAAPAQQKQKKAISSLVLVETGIDNYQKFNKFKNQRKGRSAEEEAGSCRYALQQFIQKWPPGSIIMSHGIGGAQVGKFTVLAA
jgi:hypothetical protein